MEKVKYAPEEIDRMIDEEISRIDANNSFKAREKGKRKCLKRLLCCLRQKAKRSSLRDSEHLIRSNSNSLDDINN